MLIVIPKAAPDTSFEPQMEPTKNKLLFLLHICVTFCENLDLQNKDGKNIILCGK